ncbi:hypothetical protein KC921_02360 [Candidatus Woesebacteria bacterium]|nr:hypothetical protein [Candidatus Woesebacteria bacterium]
MNLFPWVVTGIALVGNGLLGLLVLLKNPRSATNVFFTIFSFILALYLLLNQLSLLDASPEIRLSWMRSVMVAGSMLNLSFFLFVSAFPSNKLVLSMKKKVVSVIFTLVVAVLATTPLLFSGLDQFKQPIPGPAMALFLIHTAGLLGGGFFILIRKFRRNKNVIKSQIRLVLIGTVSMFVLILITNVAFVFLLNNSNFVGLLPIYTLIFTGVSAVAIIKHRFLDIDLIVLRAVTYAILIIVTTATYAVTLFALTLVLPRSIQPKLSIVVAILIAFTFGPLQKGVEHVTQKVLFKKAYSTQILLEKLGHILRSNISLVKLTNKVLEELIQSMSLTKAIIITTNESGIYAINKVGSDSLPEITIKQVNQLVQVAKSKPLIFDDLDEGDIKQLLRDFDMAFVLPITVKSTQLGLLMLGEKSSGEIFNHRDLQVLEIFSHQLSLAINNALSYEEISEFNVTLKDEVKRATSKLKAANNRLRELDKVKDEFVSIASHELRTPLTSIRNYQWMILNNKGGKLSEKQRYYIERSYQATNRLTKLVTDMLNVSRIDSGRILLDVEKAYLPDLTEAVIEELQVKIRERQIDVIHEVPKKDTLPFVTADSDKVKEVIINLIYNALKFTPEKGTITVSYKKSAEGITVLVKDTGIGIDSAYLGTLFTKFGFVKDSLRANHPTTDSTGLGLYISKSIIELHGGKIWVESEGANKGSTFCFTLPVYNKKDFETLHKKYKKEKDAGLLHNAIS